MACSILRILKPQKTSLPLRNAFKFFHGSGSGAPPTYAAVDLMGSLCFGAFFMSFRLLRYAFSPRPGRLTPDKFYKGRSQEKTLLDRLGFFLLRSPLDRARSVPTFRAMCSVSRDCAPVVWVFSTSGFSSLVRDEACQFRNQKAER